MIAYRLALLAAVLAPLLPLGASRAAYPEKAVTVIVSHPPGGRTDLTARLLAQHLSKHLGQPAMVVNKSGAGGVIGARDVAGATPDGHTIGVFSTALLTAQYTVATPTDLKDYTAIAVINLDPMALAVKADAPWKTLKGLVAYGRKNPGELRISTIPGASAQIFAAAFSSAAKVEGLYVPFKGDSDGATSLAGGHIDVHVAVPASYKSLAEAGKIRMLGIAAESRSALSKDIPTFRENGVDLVIGSFHVVMAPRKTPADVVRVLETAVDKAMREPELIKQMEAASLGYANMNQKETAAFLAQQDAVYQKVIDQIGMRVARQN